MATRYWVVSLPVQNSASSLWNRLQDQISKHSLDTPLYRFNTPNLRVGTLDSLLSLSDDLLKVRVAEYNNMRSQLNAINRKQSGSLAVRDLSNLVKPEDIITSEHLVTLLAIVPKYSQKDWLASYETLTSYVVPRSSKKLYEENEYALYTVTLFGCVADNFRTAARERGFQIRDFEYSPEAQESRKQELEKLMQDPGSLRSSLLQWCYNSYGEVFSSWMQFCPVRVFAESILRYGLPPSFLACVLAPSVKSEKKVRSILEGTYWKTEDEAGGGVAGLAGDADAHPYVSFTINLI
uniref:V-type proton ATPase subunit C n=1 Tax=Quercus lobata TaxID=97700 RepID=A0A7N2QZL6_QUELO